MKKLDKEESVSTKSLKKEVMSFFVTIVGSILFVVVFINFIMRPITVEGNSMFPTLKSKSKGFTNVLLHNIQEINRFEIVVFKSPLNPSEFWVKRVIGLPGERIRCTYGIVYINDVPLDESMLQLSEDTVTSDFDEVILEDGMYFLMGDNREVSFDSRQKEVGPIHKSKIVGKDVLVLYPFSEFGYEK